MTVNEILSTGLVTQTLPEIITELENGYKAIYGNDINVASNTPDGQLINIEATQKRDLLDVITDVNNSFDPDQASGSTLDSRVAINGLTRAAGTYTLTPVSITVDRSLTLYGLDQSVVTPFTVADSSGQQFNLLSTVALSAGTSSLLFQAADIGAVLTTLNTITTQITVVVGVTAVNNPLSATNTGVDQESDADLRLRRQASTQKPAANNTDALYAALMEVANVSAAYVHVNDSGSPDAYSCAAHTVWPVVEGGIDADIAAEIYRYRGGGEGQAGSEVVTVLRADGRTFDIKFDRPTYTQLYVRFSLTPKKSTATYVVADLKTDLAAALDFGIFEAADTATIVLALSELLPLYIASNVEISTDKINWYEIIDPISPVHKFTVSAGNIYVVTYDTGTVDATSGDDAIVGTTTLWNTNNNAVAGDYFQIDGYATIYVIESISDDTNLVLTTNAADNANDLTYKIMK